MIILLQPVLTIIAITLQLFICGYTINQKLGIWNLSFAQSQNIWLKIFFAFCTGYASDTTILFVLGISGYLTSLITIFTLTTVTFICGLLLKPKSFYRFKLHALLPAIGTLIIYVIVVLAAIRSPGHWDDTAGHLPIARYYMEHHQILLQPYHRFPLFPQNMNILFTLGLMLGYSKTAGIIIAQFLAAFPVFITCIGLIGILQYKVGNTWLGFVASIALLTIAPIRNLLGFAYIDFGLMLYCWATMLAFVLNNDQKFTKSWYCPWLFIAGLMAGMTMGTKYFGAVLVGMLGLWFLIIQRNWRGIMIYGSTAFIFGSWWYIRSWFISGDPFHPLAANIFGYFMWNANDLNGQISEQSTHGVPKELLFTWAAVQKAGAPIIALMPFSLFFWLRMNIGMRLIFLSSISYFFFWFYVTQVERYLAPIWAPAAFFAVWGIWQFGQTLINYIPTLPILKPIHGIMLSSLVCIVTPIPTLKSVIKQYKFQFLHWNEILEQHSGYSLMQYANTLIPVYGNRLLNVGFENAVFYYEGLSIGDWFGIARYSQMIENGKLISPKAMRQVMAYHNTLSVVINTRFKIDMQAYEKEFKLQHVTRDGVLFTIR